MSFSQKVLEKAKQIPKGKVTTYKLLAKACGNQKAVRAVPKFPKFSILWNFEDPRFLGYFAALKIGLGQALNKNTCSYLSNGSKSKKIPCHRVVYSNGKIGGFSKGIKQKIVLLGGEGIKIEKGRVVEFKEILYKF